MYIWLWNVDFGAKLGESVEYGYLDLGSRSGFLLGLRLNLLFFSSFGKNAKIERNDG